MKELEPCPIKLTINSAKKILEIEKIAKTSIQLLPPLEIAVLKNGKKYLLKGHSICEALKKIGQIKFKANMHFVSSVIEVITLHARMSQTNPINPLAIIDMKNYLANNGFSMNKIIESCLLDPGYVSLLKCDLSSEARQKLSLLIDTLAIKLNRVEIPVYMIEMISKRPLEIQGEIVDRIRQFIGDEKTLSQKDFIFPNQGQIKLYTEISKKPEKRNVLIFRREEHLNINKIQQNKTMLESRNIKKEEIDNLLGNSEHLALMEIGNKKFRLDWKTKTFSEIKEFKNEFIVIQNSYQLRKILTLTEKQIKFLNLTDEQKLYVNNIDNPKQLLDLANRCMNEPELRIITISNK